MASVNLAEYTYKLTLDSSEYNQRMKNADEQAEGMKAKLSNVGSFLKTSLVAGMAAAGAGVVALGKQAITAYGDYEQLIGGVETLFKNSASVVNEYAANAYKTAGMSANTYMETVTSFSASLLQSLNGDTAKAAQVADMAITDMSDNANKMGSSMESIQNAYQGFAKQNYTMLDNLKLGYGGTKEEMARLLSDAEKLSGQKYDISNLNDVYEAIHVVQTELGVTGTTAKEASTTLQGSAAGMKAAWSNLLVGLADENQNFDSLLENLINSIGTFAENLLPRIKIAFSGVAKLAASLGPQIAAMLPGIASDILPQVAGIAISVIQNLFTGLANTVPQLISKLVDSISQALPLLITSAVQAVITLAQGLVDTIPSLIDAAMQMIQGLANGIITAIPVLIEAVPEIIDNLVNAILENIPLIIQTGISLFVALVEALPDIIVSIVAAIPEIVLSIVDALINNIPLIIDAGIQLLTAIIGNLPLIITTIIQSIPQIVSAIVETFNGLMSRMQEVGSTIANNIWNGIKNIWDSIVTWFSDSITSLLAWFAGLGESFTSVGSNMLNWVWDGLKSVWENVSSWVQEKVEWITEKLAFWKKSQSKMKSGNSGNGDDIDGSHANGLSYVPFDNYKALLHKGERVLTAKENAAYNSNNYNNNVNSNTPISLQMGDIIIQGSADQNILSQIKQAQTQATNDAVNRICQNLSRLSLDAKQMVSAY